jgi:hypothetical protein
MVWIFFVIVVSSSGSPAGTETYRFPDFATCEYVRQAFVERGDPRLRVTGCRVFQPGTRGVMRHLSLRGIAPR